MEGAIGRSFEGTGIGLSLVQELVKLHGGIARATSVEGEGSTFTVSLPTGRAHLPADRVAEGGSKVTTGGAASYVLEASRWTGADQEQEAVVVSSMEDVPTAPAATGSGRGPAHVLVVDDNADMRSYLERLLCPHWQIEVVADGASALESARNQPPDLVLSDVMMPGLDGYGLLRALRGHPRTSHIPVVLLSARAGEEAVLEGLETGADDYLIKPFSARELLARVQTHLELARLRREWAAELESANRELEAFSYSVSHDLRAPLRAIDGFAEALHSDHGSQLDEQGRQYLERVRAAVKRMGQLIEDLLSLSRVTRAPLHREPVNLTDVARRAIADLAGREPHRRVEARVSDGLVVHGDPRLLRVMIENLVGNAWKFTSKTESARVEFGAGDREGGTVFFVRDNGAGFDMEYAAKLFKPFQRLHSEADFDGTGIGLATVHRVVTRHGGRVWAEATPGRGATFSFTIGESGSESTPTSGGPLS